MSYKNKIYLLILPGNISLNPTDSGLMSSTTLFFCSSSESASALSKVDPSFSALDVTDLQINPFLKRRELELTILEEENNCLTHPLALRSLFSNVKENALTLFPGWMFSTLSILFSSVSVTKIGNSVWFLILNLNQHLWETSCSYNQTIVEPWSQAHHGVAYNVICSSWNPPGKFFNLVHFLCPFVA